MFFLAEYINMFTVSALATTVFLGGWQAPPLIAAIGDGMVNSGYWGILWFTLKVWSFMFFFVWLRGSLPRVRYDQFMKLGWKLMIPATLAWVVLVAFMRGAALGWFGTSTVVTIFGRGLSAASLILIGLVLVALFVVGVLLDRGSGKTVVQPQRPDEIDPFAGGFPVPPLPGQTLREPERGIPAVAASTLTAKEESRG